MERIWGFDLGTTSVGFAVLELNEDNATGAILHQGVRIFPEGRTEKDLEPRNQARRAARLLRRQHRRRRLRRKLLRHAFAEAGLLPRFGTPEWDAFMNTGADPYALRARALRERLEPHQLGRALYHLAHRRGFLSARRPGLSDRERKAREKEEGPVLEEIKGLREKLQGRTLGEFLATDPSVERRRDRHIGRDMVEDEFNRLWQAQAPFHPGRLTEELREDLRRILFYQRPIFWRLQTIGQCSLERGQRVCPNGSWLGQEFQMLQQLNNLRVAAVPERALDSEERSLLLRELHQRPQITFGAVRKCLKNVWAERGLPSDHKFNLELGGEKRLLGNAVEAKLADVFGDAWDTYPARDRLRDDLFPRLFQLRYRQLGEKRAEIRRQDQFKFRDEITPEKDRFLADAQKEYGITAQQAAALADFEPPTGWLRFSATAIRKLLPYLEQRLVLNEKGGALDLAYPGWRDRAQQTLDLLPSHHRHMPQTRNPSVHRALNELRKVTNNLLRAYGKPQRIRLELIRELKKTKKQREEVTSRYREQEGRRKRAADDLREHDIKPLTAEAIEKWLLWQESKETCPYTGRKISFDALFRRGDFQVEHIFPLSRSLDNNYLNKTLCATDLNREKGDRTPFEFFRHNPEKWDEVAGRLAQWVKDKGFPREKMQRFLRPDYPEGQEFLEERQLADTGYIAVEARKFLARLGVPVDVTSGPVTAQLRSAWGLDAILSPEAPWRKNRADHRHHAVDALAVALTSPAHVKRLSDYYARGRRGEKPRFDPPWDGFHQEADRKTRAIVVSHRVQRKVSGPLHAQTYYGDTGQEVTEGGITYRLFVTRKPLEAITRSQIDDIRDPTIKELVKKHVEEHGGDPKKAFPPYPALVTKETGEAREIKKVRVLVKQQKHLMVPLRPSPKTFADPGDNHHMAIFQLFDGSVHYETVSLFEATRRLKAGEPVVRRTSKQGGRFLMSLAPGDILEFPAEDGGKHYRVVTSVWAAGPVVLQEHTEAGDKVWSRPNVASLVRQNARKVKVDPIGRVRPAHD